MASLAIEKLQELVGERVVFQHQEGKAAHPNFTNDNKVGEVVGLDEYNFPIKVRLEGGGITYIEPHEIKDVL